MAAMSPPVGRPPVVVALGASNLSRGLARFTAGMRGRLGAPTMLVAAGHGRSYGASSRVAWRRLPSIRRCGLWRALDRLDPDDRERQSLALVTDIGNDLLYGFSAAQTAGWVRECLARLADRGSRVAVTALPLASVARAGPLRYRLLRTIYVPGCPLSLPALQTAAADLDSAVRAAAVEFDAYLIEQPGDWYGLDSLHVRRRRLDTLWDRTCQAWGLPESCGGMRRSFSEWARIGSRAAEVRSLAGEIRLTPQPVVRWRDGSSLSLY
jgi:hypothetical protein